MSAVTATFSARLLTFNLLPSLTLHPSRHAAFGAPSQPVPAACAAAWHRHWSAAILRRLGLWHRPVLDADHPVLALALLPPDRLARLARHVGAACCAPRLRQVIAGPEVRELIAALGADVLDFARRADHGSWACAAGAVPGPVSALAGQVDAIGRTVLRQVFQPAGPELALRAELKLEDDARTADAAGTEAAATDSTQRLQALVLAVLEHIEPTWHSSFHAKH